MSDRRTWTLGLPAFLALSVGLVALLWHDMCPAPLYRLWHTPGRRATVHPEKPIAVAFGLPKPPPSSFVFPVNSRSGTLALEVTASDVSNGEVLAKQTVREEGLAEIELPAFPDTLERLQITFANRDADLQNAPLLVWSQNPPGHEGLATYGSEPLEQRGPLLLLRWEGRSRWTLLLWLLVPVALLPALRRERLEWILPVTLGLAAAASGFLLWREHFSLHTANGDPDAYGRAAERLADWIRDPGTRQEGAEWLHGYPHAHTMLASLLLVLPVLFDVPFKPAFCELNALVGFVSIALLFRILRRRLALGPAASCLGAALFASHLIFLRTSARPMPDPLGNLLWILVLDLLLARMERPTRARSAMLACALFLGALARPTGVPVFGFAFLSIVWIDARREGALRWAALARRGALLFGLPALALALLYLAFGWDHNLELMFRVNRPNRHLHNPDLLQRALVACLQLQPLLWLGLLGARLRDRRLWLLGAALAFYLAMLVLVRTPYYTRYFLQLVPVSAALAAAGFEAARRPLRPALGVLGALLCAFNAGLVAYQILRVPEVLLPVLIEVQ